MVEDHWRSLLAVAKQNPQVAKESILRFQERIQTTASLMQTEHANTFLQVVEEEREVLFTEYERNPDDLKRRLGLRSNIIAETTFDPETVRATVRDDYEVLRQIAVIPGLSVAAAAAEVDAELDRLTRSHVKGMTPDQAGQFMRTYNEEYNRLVIERLQNETCHYQRQTIGEIAVRTAVRATIWESVLSLFRLFR